MQRKCGHIDCRGLEGNHAAYLVVETNPLSMLIRSGAGFFCDGHARMLRSHGAVVIHPVDLQEAADKTDERLALDEQDQ